MAELTMEQMRDKLLAWSFMYPKLTYKALGKATATLQKDIKIKWSDNVIRTNSGALIRAVKRKQKLNPLSASVYVDPKQQYKAMVFEGKAANPHVAKGRFMQITPIMEGGRGDFWGRPRQVFIRPRPVWDNVERNRHQEMLLLIKTTIIEGIEKGKY